MLKNKQDDDRYARIVGLRHHLETSHGYSNDQLNALSLEVMEQAHIVIHHELNKAHKAGRQ